MENFDELLKKYADFIVRVGVNPQPGQTLIINCPLEGAPLARLCVRSAYETAVDDEGLARLGVHAHTNDEVGVFFQKKSKVFHRISFLPCKPRRCIFYLTV